MGLAAVLLALLLAPGAAQAHGIWGHVHVTGWAIENMPDGALKDFFGDVEVRNAALFGSAFTDSGYFPQSGDLSDRTRAYSEHTHWEPFIEDFVAWVIENDPPPWATLDSRQRVAFLMGCGAHGLQDEIFDSLFLFQIQHHDHEGQDAADPGTDGFLALDGHLRLLPERWIPTETVVGLYDSLDAGVTASDIEAAVHMMELLYLNPAGYEVAASLGRNHAERIPWARQHYLDPDIPGSLRSEVRPTALYMQAMWDRLHGREAAEIGIIHAWPEVPRRLRSADPSVPDSWVAMIHGVGLRVRSLEASWLDAMGAPVGHRLDGTRWGGLGAWGRVIRVHPTDALESGETYTVRLEPGAELVDGSVSEAGYEHTFEVGCEAADDPLCPPVEEPPEVDVDGPPGAPDVVDSSDAGTADTGPDDGGASNADGSVDDGAGASDPGAVDSSPGTNEGGPEEDSGADVDVGAVADPGQTSQGGGGGCRLIDRRGPGTPCWLLLFVAVAAIRRRIRWDS